MHFIPANLLGTSWTTGLWNTHSFNFPNFIRRKVLHWDLLLLIIYTPEQMIHRNFRSPLIQHSGKFFSPEILKFQSTTISLYVQQKKKFYQSFKIRTPVTRHFSQNHFHTKIVLMRKTLFSAKLISGAKIVCFYFTLNQSTLKWFVLISFEYDSSPCAFPISISIY